MTNSELYHHGILGQKWGVRRYENKNGTLTSAGKKRYADADANGKVDKNISSSKSKNSKKSRNENNRQYDELLYGTRGAKRIEKRMSKGQSHTKAQIAEIGREAVEGMLASVILADVASGGQVHRTLGNLTMNSIKKYASEKATQRANASLARIGTMTLKHVAGDVYETVMV